MKFNMLDLNPGDWFLLEPEKKDSGRVKVRVLNSGKLAEIRDSTIRTEVEYRGENRFEYQKIDHSARDSIVWDYCIVDWEGIIDDDDKPIECNTENKIKLMNNHIGFSNFIQNCLERLNRQSEIYSEYLEKN